MQRRGVTRVAHVSEWVDRKVYATINGKKMAYVELGSGDPIVCLHGNPTSSFLWRDIAPKLQDAGRVIVPDLIGMGDSDKLAATGRGAYRFVDHRQYLNGLLDTLGITNAVLVLHDWGSALGFDWARRHQDRVKGLVYMEALVCPMSLEEWPPRKIFESLRSDDGEAMVLDNNVFVEKILPRSILRELTEAEMNEYRRPFAQPGEARRPTLTWPREVPLSGEPADVVNIVDSYSQWLQISDIPKLFINAEPGAILTGRMREVARAFPNQTEVTVAGSHFIQEDSPAEIADAIRRWLPKLPTGAPQPVTG
jgi:haloalkane dehalogenase